jgi:hypothetical protein
VAKTKARSWANFWRGNESRVTLGGSRSAQTNNAVEFLFLPPGGIIFHFHAYKACVESGNSTAIPRGKNLENQASA